MKKILFAICLFITTAALGQHLPPTREDYQTKSAHQHTAGLALLIGGGAIFAGGIIWGAGESGTDDNNYSKYDGAGALILIGAVSMLGSIPFLIASHRNGKKARALAAHFKFEPGPNLQGIGMGGSHAIPGLALQLRF